jgi:hypothetical protein
MELEEDGHSERGEKIMELIWRKGMRGMNPK